MRLMVSGIMYIRDAEYWLVVQVSRRYVTASLGALIFLTTSCWLGCVITYLSLVLMPDERVGMLLAA